MDVFKKRPPPHLATRVDICLYYRNQSKETSTRFDSARLYGLNDNDNDDGDALEDHHQLLSRCLSILLLPLNTGIVILKLGFIHSQTQTKPCPSDPVVSVESPLQLPHLSLYFLCRYDYLGLPILWIWLLGLQPQLSAADIPSVYLELSTLIAPPSLSLSLLRLVNLNWVAAAPCPCRHISPRSETLRASQRPFLPSRLT